ILRPNINLITGRNVPADCEGHRERTLEQFRAVSDLILNGISNRLKAVPDEAIAIHTEDGTKGLVLWPELFDATTTRLTILKLDGGNVTDSYKILAVRRAYDNSENLRLGTITLSTNFSSRFNSRNELKRLQQIDSIMAECSH
ncbi:MAG: hypothetical protein KDK33_08870, partial [Leptospiraceae bacterium]|nr:hypothetical protein [Leptospiraceae bacterium]